MHDMQSGNRTQLKVRRTTSLLLLVVAATILFWYLRSHPAAVSSLKNVTTSVLMTVNLLYIASTFTLVMIMNETVLFSSKKVSMYESFLVTCYSTCANYLIPGQSGPGVRALYLKTNHKVPVRVVLLGTLVYLLWVLALSTCMVLYVAASSRVKEALLVMAVLAFVVLVLLLLLRTCSAGPTKARLAAHSRLVSLVGVWTLLQLVVIAAIYYVELTAIDPRISISQTVGYSGVANLSLLVAITPGAIGIREAFLIISQNIHNIPTETIAAASALDRASYVLLLFELGIFIFFSHARNQFRLSE